MSESQNPKEVLHPGCETFLFVNAQVLTCLVKYELRVLPCLQTFMYITAKDEFTKYSPALVLQVTKSEVKTLV